MAAAGKEWVNGYLQAIRDSGVKLQPPASGKVGPGPVDNGRERAPYRPARYFVGEEVSPLDDRDLHKTFTEVAAMRDSQERTNRMENLCWRTWHVARKKQGLGSREAIGGEKGKPDGTTTTAQPSPVTGALYADGGDQQHRSSTISPDDGKIESDEESKNRNLYIVLISIHGLVRGENMELGRDSDTGGQVKHVVELARALAATDGAHRVELLTRQICSPDVDRAYGEPVEALTPDGDGSRGAYIVRLPCGPKDRYIPKEYLWPHVPEFADRAAAHVGSVARELGGRLGRPVWPHVVHGHYADGAEVAARLSSVLSVPMVMTAQSLGRNKVEQLLQLGHMTRAGIYGTYRMARRVEAEELALDTAEMVVTGTKQEIGEQWGLYDGFDPAVERDLRARTEAGGSCLGRYMPRLVVITPSIDFSCLDTKDLMMNGDGDPQTLMSSKANKDLPPIWSEVLRFFTNPHKPIILALSRPDPKKNVTTLLKAYGESRRLRELANLALILGNRDSIPEMPGDAAAVLRDVLILVDQYDLYGQVAYPKHHKQTDVPLIYRLAAETKGVFINPALIEPFGLTIIEASAHGLPVVATKNGGPVDTLNVLGNGILVDPHDAAAITGALLSLLDDKARWVECRRNALRNIHQFSWSHHCRVYLSNVAANCHRRPRARLQFLRAPNGPDANGPLTDALHISAGGSNRRALGFLPGRRQSLLVIAADCYSDDGQPDVEHLKKAIDLAMAAGDGTGGRLGYVLSTGMTIRESVEALGACGVDPAAFDALICSGGAEICYPWNEVAADEEYAEHVAFRWPGEHVRAAVPKLGKADGAQEADLAVDEAACSVHCHAYAVRGGTSKVKKIDAIKQALRIRGFRCNLVYTRACARLNVIPLSASRPHALRYLSMQWGSDLSKVAVLVGDKGDTDRECLLPGLHKTLILPGLVSHGSEELLRGEEGYTTEDVVAMDSPNIVTLAEDQAVSDLKVI